MLPGTVQMSLSAPRSPVPTWVQRCWLAWSDPQGLGNVCSQPSSMSRWVPLAKRAQGLALMFWDATAYRWHCPLLFQDINPLGRRPCHLYVLVLECWSLHDAEDRAVVSTPLASFRGFFFSSNIYDFTYQKISFYNMWMFPLRHLPDITSGRAGSFKCALVSSYKTKFGHQRTIFAKGFPLVLWHRRGRSQCPVLASGQWGCGLQQSHG